MLVLNKIKSKGYCCVVGSLSQNKVRQPVMTAGMGLYTGTLAYRILFKVQSLSYGHLFTVMVHSANPVESTAY